ncbi:uncharacterized protein LACBIDRAFT_322448 [Laccaria bicolor S238N-H82]|uniref:Predicted protein n=1 Tax=Laccaria bicolor (strain S238N-H82 / ATCC MYA-4686) TaxID=486041 RepID=B0CWB5_LACBS|nr:uncharacterized protein LACBIDRAFT_322448 [Laccaria bicolor S238N-H82]EDR13038.1 predicted protein [Laccaria bicolor S238N-H82]|eukprot:XP_001875536.1 predicted protein [Laccaria bicolor S238N-H82]
MSQTYIDDQDPTRVTYKGSWTRGGTAAEYNNTVSSSTVVGDSFTVSFQGNSITVYGTIDATSGGVTTNYFIDGGAVSQAVSLAGSNDTYKQQFWQSDTLQSGAHTLNVTMVKVNAESQSGEGTVWFDYFVANSTGSSSTSLTTSTSTTSASSITNSDSATPTPTPTGKKSNLGGILGGVIGGVVLFLIFLLCLWRYRRRRNNSGKVAQFKPDIDPDPSSPTSADYISPFDTNSANIDPFPLGYRGIGSIDNSSRLSSSSWAPALQQKSSLHHATNSMSTSSHGNFSVDPSGFAESLAGSSGIGRPTSAGASSKSRHLLRQPSEVTVSTFLPPVQHVDSGMRSIDMEMLTSPPELPPVYSPV